MYNQMKEKKKALRSAQRCEVATRREQMLNNIMSASQSDSRKMFSLISRAKGTSAEITDILCQNGYTYTGADQVRKAWKNHYASLAASQEPQNPTWYDGLVNWDYLLMLQDAEYDSKYIQTTEDDVEKAIKSLKFGKACDINGITTEHFHYGPGRLLVVLTRIINVVFERKLIPALLKVGLMSSVFKKKPPVTNPSNHRGITVIIIITKVIEITLRTRVDPVFLPSQNPLQRGFTKGVAPIYAAWILQETINECEDQGHPLYIAFLDAKAAFDTVWLPSLMRKIKLCGIEYPVWSLLDQLHKDATAVIKWKGKLSESFPVSQGVRQGGIISTTEYKVFINPLLNQLSSMAMGSYIGSINCAAPTCADDITVVAEAPEDLQTLINVVYSYSQRERYILQPAKCQIIVCNYQGGNPPYTWSLQGSQLKVVDNAAHIGINRDTDTGGRRSTIEQNILKARRALYSLLPVGLQGRRGLNPLSNVKLYSCYVLPILTYGLELFQLTVKELESLEAFHNSTLKQILGLPNSSATPVVFILSGILPLEALMHRRTLNMFNTLCGLNGSTEQAIIRRQLVMKDLNSGSWVSYVRRLLAKYDLPSAYLLIENPYSKAAWKRSANRAVNKYWENVICSQASTYSSLKYIRWETYRADIPHLAVEAASTSVTECRRLNVKLRILTGTYSLQANRASTNQHHSKLCPLCNKSVETRSHFVASCPVLHDVREEGMISVRDVAKATLDTEIPLDLSEDERTMLLVDPSLFVLRYNHTHKSSLIPLELSTRDIIYKLHVKRQKLLNSSSLGIRRIRKPKKKKSVQRKAADKLPTPNGGAPTTGGN
jgi:hypothetical protein